MNRPRVITPAVILGAIGLACALTVATLALIGLTATPRAADPGFAPAVLTVIPAPTSTLFATLTATFDPNQIFTPTLPPDQIVIGAYVQITGTEGQGLRLRSGPGLSSALLFLGEDSEVFHVEDGPQDADGYTWWYIVAPYDTSRAGWAASTFLTVVPSPQ
ncbi:MAG: hypothetical protein AB1750_05555 [Chloroflexota bacterium]